MLPEKKPTNNNRNKYMTHFDPSKNKIFFGNTDKLVDWSTELPDQAKIIDKIKLMLKNYLELDNVSFLFGSGTSIHLGAVAIRNFPVEVESYIKQKYDLVDETYENFLAVIKKLQADLLKYGKENLIEGTLTFNDNRNWSFEIVDEIVRDNTSKEIAIEYEKVLNYLIAADYVFDQDQSVTRTDKYAELIIAIKEGLFNVCNLEKREVSQSVINRKKASQFEKEKEQGNLLENKSKYIFHEKFVKALLQRPLN